MRSRTMLCLVIVLLGVSRTSGQSPPQTPPEIARFLNDHGTVVQVLAKGKVKQSIKKESPTFVLPEGESRVLLLKLPDYQAPYTLTISSSLGGFGLTKDVFVPSILAFDADFQKTREFPDSQFAQKSNSLTSTIVFDDQQKSDRFLLLYTRADLVGQRMDKVHPNTTTGGLAEAGLSRLLVHAARSANGTIQAETKPKK